MDWVAFDPTPRVTQAAGLGHATALAVALACFLLLAGPLALRRRRSHGSGEGLLVRLARQGQQVATLRESATVLGRTIGPRTAELARAGARPVRR